MQSVIVVGYEFETRCVIRRELLVIGVHDSMRYFGPVPVAVEQTGALLTDVVDQS